MSTEELLGRQSGNEAWRRARGELGDIVRASNEAEITARTSKSHSTGATTGNASTTEGDATKQNDKRSNKDSKLGPSQPESAFHGIGLAQSQHEVSLTESKHDNGTGGYTDGEDRHTLANECHNHVTDTEGTNNRTPPTNPFLTLFEP